MGTASWRQPYSGSTPTRRPARRSTNCFSHEDLEQDETPSAHATDEPNHWRKKLCFTSIAKSQHKNSTNQQAPEDHAADLWLHRRQDQVELDHLQGDGDGPINVTIQDWRAVEGDPVLAHVEVVDSCNQGNQGTYIPHV